MRRIDGAFLIKPPGPARSGGAADARAPLGELLGVCAAAEASRLSIPRDGSPVRDPLAAQPGPERRHHHIGSAWIQLVGLDATDSIVSFTAPGRVRWRSDSDSEFFTLALRPRGTEQRFEVRLYSFEYQEEMSP